MVFTAIFGIRYSVFVILIYKGMAVQIDSTCFQCLPFVCKIWIVRCWPKAINKDMYESIRVYTKSQVNVYKTIGHL